MQNKPNFQDVQMNVSIFSKMAYEYKHNWTLGENKPNQTQLKPISMPIKPKQTQSRNSSSDDFKLLFKFYYIPSFAQGIAPAIENVAKISLFHNYRHYRAYKNSHFEKLADNGLSSSIS